MGAMPLPAVPALARSDRERCGLQKFTRLRSAPQGGRILRPDRARRCRWRGQRSLLSASLPTVLRWRRRYPEEGMAGILQDRPGSGRPEEISAQQETALIEKTLHTIPINAMHRSVRMMADEVGLP